MGRLKTMPARVKPAKGRLSKATVPTMGSARYARLYRTSRWQKLRWQVLVDGAFTCVMCGHLSAQDMVCDHVNGHPHTETEEQFWAGPFQVLCRPCHDSAKRKLDDAIRAA